MERGKGYTEAFGGNYLKFSIDEIDRMCIQELQKNGCYPKEVKSIDIERFVEKCYNITIDYRDLGKGVLGCTKFSNRGAVLGMIIGDDGSTNDHSERRLRSTIAHEAGHCMLHASLFISDHEDSYMRHPDLDLKERRILCRSENVGLKNSSIRPYDGKWWEWQANRAIGGFLMPKPLVKKAIQEFQEPNEEELIRKLSDTFDVNPIVAKIRLGEM